MIVRQIGKFGRMIIIIIIEIITVTTIRIILKTASYASSCRSSRGASPVLSSSSSSFLLLDVAGKFIDANFPGPRRSSASSAEKELLSPPPSVPIPAVLSRPRGRCYLPAFSTPMKIPRSVASTDNQRLLLISSKYICIYSSSLTLKN